MLWLALACGRDKGVGGDTGDGPEPEVIPALSQEATWQASGPDHGTGLAWADLDRDGDADLVVSYGNDVAPGPLAVYENDGGSVSPAPTWTSASAGYFGHLSVGDVDGDGLPDVAVSRFLGDAGFAEPGGLAVFFNDGGILEDTPRWEAGGFFSFSCALGDVDADGDLDLAAAAGEAYYNDPDLARVYENDGRGAFSLLWTADAPRYAFDVGWADLDGDGWLDLLLASQGSPHAAYFGGPEGLAAAPGWEAGGEGFEGNTLDWGDVDGDGSLDVVVSDNDQLGGAGVVRLWCGPDLELCWTSADSPGMQSAVSLEDVDGDGDLDLAAGEWWGEARIYENDGGQLAGTPAWRADETAVIEAFAWEDIDGSHWEEAEISGERLVMIPGRGRVLSAEGGVAGEGYVSGPGAVRATYLRARARDLAVSDWDPAGGERIYGRER